MEVMEKINIIMPCGHSDIDRQKMGPKDDSPKCCTPLHGTEYKLLFHIFYQFCHYILNENSEGDSKININSFTYIYCDEKDADITGKAKIKKDLKGISRELYWNTVNFDHCIINYTNPLVPSSIFEAINKIVDKNEYHEDSKFMYYPDDILFVDEVKKGEKGFKENIKRAIRELKNNKIHLIVNSKNYISEGIVRKGDDDEYPWRIDKFLEKTPTKIHSIRGCEYWNTGILLFTKKGWKIIKNIKERLLMQQGNKNDIDNNIFKIIEKITLYKKTTSEKLDIDFYAYNIHNSWFHLDTYTQIQINPRRYSEEWDKIISSFTRGMDKIKTGKMKTPESLSHPNP